MLAAAAGLGRIGHLSKTLTDNIRIGSQVGNLPTYYDYLNSGRTTDPGFVGRDGELYFGHQYVFGTPQPWFEFGYGLSYTTFEYSKMSLSATNVSASDSLTAAVHVKNTGENPLYNNSAIIHRDGSDWQQRSQELRDFLQQPLFCDPGNLLIS